MAWLPVTKEDVLAIANPAVIKRAFDVDDAGQETSWFNRMRSVVVASIRAKVASCGGNTLSSSPNLVPPEWVGYAALWIYSKILGKVTSQTGLTDSAFQLSEDQRNELRRYETNLDLVAKCELDVTIPDEPEDTPSTAGGAAVELVTDNVREYTRTTMRGLNG